MVKMVCASALPSPFSSASSVNAGPAQSISVMTGMRNFSAMFMARCALRKPSGPMYGGWLSPWGVAERCCATTMTDAPYRSPTPQMTDGSSAASRSPWNSTNSRKTRSM